MRLRVRSGKAQELVLDIEYGPAVLPPKLRETVPHDDWCAHQRGPPALTAPSDRIPIFKIA